MIPNTHPKAAPAILGTLESIDAFVVISIVLAKSKQCNHNIHASRSTQKRALGSVCYYMYYDIVGTVLANKGILSYLHA